MAVTKYTYPIADFTGLIPPYTVPNVGRLTQEIQTSAIIVALDHIDGSETACAIWFKDALSAGDETILDGIVAAHSGEPLVDNTPVMVRIVDNNLLDPATSLCASTGFHATVAAEEDSTDYTISFPYEIDVSAARYFVDPDDANVKPGDRFDIIGIPGGDPFVGYVTADALTDDMVIHVSETVFEYLRHGLSFKLASHDTIYTILDEDEESLTFTLDSGLTQDVSIGDLIYIRRYMCRDIRPAKGVIDTIGDLSDGAAGLCANAKIVVRYRPETPPVSAFTLSMLLIYSY